MELKTYLDKILSIRLAAAREKYLPQYKLPFIEEREYSKNETNTLIQHIEALLWVRIRLESQYWTISDAHYMRGSPSICLCDFKNPFYNKEDSDIWMLFGREDEKYEKKLTGMLKTLYDHFNKLLKGSKWEVKIWGTGVEIASLRIVHKDDVHVYETNEEKEAEDNKVMKAVMGSMKYA